MRKTLSIVVGTLVVAGCAGRAQVEETQMERLRREAERDLAALESELDSLRAERRAVDSRIVALGARPTEQQVAVALPTPSGQIPAADTLAAVGEALRTTPAPGGGEQALAPEEIVILERRVLFAFDRAELSASARQMIAEKAEVLRRYPDLSVRVVGHADRRGPDAYNQRLSERRARAVREALVQRGVQAGQIRMQGRSFHEPAVDGTTFEAHRQNRRVEVIVE